MVPRAMLFAMVALALTTGIAAANDKHLVKDTVTVGNGEYDASLFIVIPCVFSMLFAVYLYWRVSLISIEKRDGADQVCFDELKMCHETVKTGAGAFLWAEYTVCAVFTVVFGAIILVMTARLPDPNMPGEVIWDWKFGGLTLASFIVGSFTSIVSGYIGMTVAVYANARTTVTALDEGEKGWTGSFNCAFQSGAIMGFSLCGLGGSCIALFGRVGGGIFTKAADVGADLSGKVIGLGDGKKLDEDSPYNPAVIADNVGDNVGDAWPVKKESDIETVLKIQLLGTAVLMTAVLAPVTLGFLPTEMVFVGVPRVVTSTNVYGCVLVGLWAGCAIGFITEYFTSHTYRPTRDVAKACETGAATGIIYGVALGYLSSIIPVALIALTVFFCAKTTGMYGVAIGSLGMLSNLATCLTIDVYGPIADNAGGMAEMSEFPECVREKTDALDAAGNTTAAIGKGFAIGSAALVSLALIGAFITRCSNSMAKSQKLDEQGVDLMSAIVFSFLIFGANIPYWFSALTMKSVGLAANEMVREVGRQWAEIPGLRDTASMSFEERAAKRAAGQTLAKPDYARCIEISTNASLREMIAPAALVILSPILTGSFWGVEAVVGLLAGALSSSVQLAISMSNTGGAWDNSKKFCEKGGLNGWFMFRTGDGTDMSEEDFKKAAAQYNGDSCLVVPGSKPATASKPQGQSQAGGPMMMVPGWTPASMPPHSASTMPMMAPGQAFGYPSYSVQVPQSGRPKGYVSSQMVMGGRFGTEEEMCEVVVAGADFGNAVEAPSFKDWISKLATTDPERYRKIMEGDEGVKTVDGRTCVYAGKKSAVHASCVVGDTVGDPFKDTSGPALNIVMKLMAIISVVFADFFMSINSGNGIFISGEIMTM
ncbi:inorganic H+ pyrophosphatase-domain-containing protein [Baffinella frigidus]|nr:inorganic H+ pyrophosphatase-domain-containing protein [Cryptophyta sp. CCMP2293]